MKLYVEPDVILSNLFALVFIVVSPTFVLVDSLRWLFLKSVLIPSMKSSLRHIIMRSLRILIVRWFCACFVLPCNTLILEY